MIVNCQENHIQICWEVKNQATSVGLEAYKSQCPLCEEIDIAKGYNKTLILAIDKENKMKEETVNLNIKIENLETKSIKIRNILANYLS